MQAFFQKLRAGISSPRLSKYRSGDESDFEVIAKYVWNIALCEALYPALHTLEVALRNAVHQAAVGCFHREDRDYAGEGGVEGAEGAARG